MRWIKASERVPDHYRLVHLRYNNANKILSKATARYNPSMGHWISVNGFEVKDCFDLEWLDESLPAGLEDEAARLYAIPKNETGFPCRDYSVEEIIQFQRQAHIRCAGMYTGEISRLTDENHKLMMENDTVSEELGETRGLLEACKRGNELLGVEIEKLKAENTQLKKQLQAIKEEHDFRNKPLM